MLTLFEYLRQRTFEAVIEGTQDAVTFLESQGSFDRVNGADVADSRRDPASLEVRSAKVHEAQDRKAGDATTDGVLVEKPLPAPRRRGRPKKKGSTRS